jgi:hypothetical protein
MSCWVVIQDAVIFAPNVGVSLLRGALEMNPKELHRCVRTAFDHLQDPLLEKASNGDGPLADAGEISYGQYLKLLIETE